MARHQDGASEKGGSYIGKKREIDAQTICDGLPREFTGYFEHVSALGVNDKPDYSYLRKQFTSLFKRKALCMTTYLTEHF